MKELSKCLLIPPKPNKYSPEANSTDSNQVLYSLTDTITSKDSGIIKVEGWSSRKGKGNFRITLLLWAICHLWFVSIVAGVPPT